MAFPQYFVAGTGVGRAIAYAFLRENPTSEVTVGDVSLEGANNVTEWLKKVLGSRIGNRCQAVKFDVREAVPRDLKKFDAVVSALPAKYNYQFAKAAILAGTHFCDLGGVTQVTEKMLSLDLLAKGRGVSVVPDCGLAPGLALILARDLVSGLSSPTDIEIVVGGIPQYPQKPLNYSKVFSLEGLKHICYDQAPILLNGETVFLKPFSRHQTMVVPELANFSKEFRGRVETFVTAGASIAPYTYCKLGVRNLVERTLRWPGFVEIMKNVQEKDFDETISRYIGPETSARNPDLVYMKVSVRGWKSESLRERSVSLLELFDEKTGLSAMEKTTGFPTAILAVKLAQGELLPGVNPADAAFPSRMLRQWYIPMIRKYFKLKV